MVHPVYKLIKEFSFLGDLRSTLKNKILLNILFNNLSNIYADFLALALRSC